MNTGLKANARIKKSLNLSLNYSSFVQSNDATNDNLKLKNKSTFISISTLYRKQLGKVNTVSSFTMSRQQLNSNRNLNYLTHGYMINEAIYFNKSVSLNAMANFIIPDKEADSSRTHVYELSGTFNMFKKVKNTLGANYATENETNSGQGIFLNVFYPINKKIDINLRLEKNYYKNPYYLNENFDEWLGYLTISIQW